MAAMLGARLINPECLTNQLKFIKSFLGDFNVKFTPHPIDRWEIYSSVNYTIDCANWNVGSDLCLLFPFLFLVTTSLPPAALCTWIYF